MEGLPHLRRTSQDQPRRHNGDDGRLRLDKFDNYVAATGATGEQVEQVLSTISNLGTNPSFYGKWDLDVTNGQVSGTIEKVTIGNIDLPADQIQANKDLLFEAIEGRLQQLHIEADTITVSNGQIVFNGSVPTQVALAP